MGFLDKVKDTVKGKSIDREIDDAFSANSYSKRVLEASEKAKNFASPNPGYPAPPSTGGLNERLKGGPAERQFSPPQQQYMNSGQPKPLYRNQPAPAQPAQNAEVPLMDEDAFIRRRFGTEMPQGGENAPVPKDLLGFGTVPEEKTAAPAMQRDALAMGSAPDAGIEKMLDSIILGMRDLRAQNNHIIELLRGIQDRLNKY